MCWLLEGDAGGLGDKSADTISVVYTTQRTLAPRLAAAEACPVIFRGHEPST